MSGPLLLDSNREPVAVQAALGRRAVPMVLESVGRRGGAVALGWGLEGIVTQVRMSMGDPQEVALTLSFADPAVPNQEFSANELMLAAVTPEQIARGTRALLDLFARHDGRKVSVKDQAEEYARLVLTAAIEGQRP